jgi:uncharacterized membrane protein YeaQ/YmgE (transglycosylase-associated protein family)
MNAPGRFRQGQYPPSTETSMNARLRLQYSYREIEMTIADLIVFLIIGGVAGWLAGLIVKGFGFGLVGNIVVGIVGAFIAGLILPRVGLTFGGGIVASIINATIGAVILLLIVRLVRRV